MSVLWSQLISAAPQCQKKSVIEGLNNQAQTKTIHNEENYDAPLCNMQQLTVSIK